MKDRPRSARDALEEHLNQQRAEPAPRELSATQQLNSYIDDPEFRRAVQQAPLKPFQNQSDDHGPSFREMPWERQRREELDRLKDIKLSSEGIAKEPAPHTSTAKEKIDLKRYIDDADYRRVLQQRENGRASEPEPGRPGIRGRSPPGLER